MMAEDKKKEDDKKKKKTAAEFLKEDYGRENPGADDVLAGFQGKTPGKTSIFQKLMRVRAKNEANAKARKAKQAEKDKK